MGSENSALFHQEPLPKEFQQLRELPGIYQNKIDGIKLQKHFVDIKSEEEIQHEKQIFVFRRLHQQRLVAGYYFEKIDPNRFCGSLFRISYFTELPDASLDKLKKNSIEQGINLIIQCLEGFELLYEKFGGFQVKEDQFFLYSKNRMRVWLDSDAGVSRPSRSCQQQRVVQQYMISEIFKIFDHLHHSYKSPCQFTTFLRKFEGQSRNLVNFTKIIEYLKDLSGEFSLQRSKRTHKENWMNLNHIINPNQSNRLKIKKISEEMQAAERKKFARRSQQETMNVPIYDVNQTIRKNSVNEKRKEISYDISGKPSNFYERQQRIKNNVPVLNQSRKLEQKISIKNFNQAKIYMRSSQSSMKNSKVNTKRMINVKELSEKNSDKKILKQSKQNYLKVSEFQLRKRSSQESTNLEKTHLENASKQIFLQRLKTVKSILHTTDANIDSQILLDFRSSEFEHFGFGRPAF